MSVTSILVGIYSAIITTGVVLKSVDKKIDAINIIVDIANKKAMIHCSSRKIPAENFKIYTRLEHGHTYLYVKGTVVTEDTKEIISVKQKYLLKGISADDIEKMTWNVDEAERDVIITIPLSTIDKKISIRRVNT